MLKLTRPFSCAKSIIEDFSECKMEIQTMIVTKFR